MNFCEKWQTVHKKDVYCSDGFGGSFYRVHSFYKTNNSPVAFISVLASYNDYYDQVHYSISYYKDKQQWEDEASEEVKSDMIEKDALEFMQELNAVI